MTRFNLTAVSLAKSKTFLAVAAVGSLLILFQNCGQAKFRMANLETLDGTVATSGAPISLGSTGNSSGVGNGPGNGNGSGTGSGTGAGGGCTGCNPRPVIDTVVNPKIPKEGTKADYMISTAYAQTIAYMCRDAATGSVVYQGQVALGDVSVPLTITQDLYCDAIAMNAAGDKATSHIDIPVDCGNKIKSGHKCMEFSCKSVKTLTLSNGKLDIPARTADGICYSIKLMDKIANSSSSLTKTTDANLISRNHDVRYNDPNDVRKPYLMGKSNLQFKLDGARQVKLAGAQTVTTPILVDNFILVGIYPSSVTNPASEYYKAYGTSDSTVYNSNSVILNNKYVPVTAFATGGTSTITPLDITAQVQSGQSYSLDLRALDCGAARELSDIYLLFQ
jgi:hypothetical protein